MLKHLAIIPDGNRRYCKKKQLTNCDTESRTTLLNLMNWCISKNIEELSVFAWSIENWKRPQHEVNYAMQILQKILSHFIETPDRRYTLRFISSDTSKLPQKICRQIKIIESQKYQESKLNVYIYLSYGFSKGVTKEVVLKRDPDLLIRTSGEYRLSNFCMGNLTYTELLFIQPLFPECSDEIWNECLAEFQRRDRRYGQ